MAASLDDLGQFTFLSAFIFPYVECGLFHPPHRTVGKMEWDYICSYLLPICSFLSASTHLEVRGRKDTLLKHLIFQPPLNLEVAMWLSSGQWNVSRSLLKGFLVLNNKGKTFWQNLSSPPLPCWNGSAPQGMEGWRCCGHLGKREELPSVMVGLIFPGLLTSWDRP